MLLNVTGDTVCILYILATNLDEYMILFNEKCFFFYEILLFITNSIFEWDMQNFYIRQSRNKIKKLR